jgi:hypothetical protein
MKQVIMCREGAFVKHTECNRLSKCYMAISKSNKTKYLLMGNFSLHPFNKVFYGDSLIVNKNIASTTEIIEATFEELDWYEFNNTKELFGYLAKQLKGDL